MTDTLEYIKTKYKLQTGRFYEIEIPNMGRDQLATLFCELEFNKGAEIGVEKGLYSEVLLKANPNLSLYCIDAWKIDTYDPNFKDVENAQELFERYYKEAIERLSNYSGATIIKKTSMDALSEIPDESLDFVYIDANHDFVSVTNDIYHWSKKVRKGGIVSGHDYAFFKSSKFNHVKHVLPAYTRAYGILPLFIVGAESKHNPDLIRDKFRSWFFIKK